MSKYLVIAGLIVVAAGLLWHWRSKLPIGRLPGDIVIEWEHFRLYLPLTTMCLISVIVSGLVWLFCR